MKLRDCVPHTPVQTRDSLALAISITVLLGASTSALAHFKVHNVQVARESTILIAESSLLAHNASATEPSRPPLLHMYDWLFKNYKNPVAKFLIEHSIVLTIPEESGVPIFGIWNPQDE